jgi:hypothetical protein
MPGTSMEYTTLHLAYAYILLVPDHKIDLTNLSRALSASFSGSFATRNPAIVVPVIFLHSDLLYFKVLSG